MAGMTLRRKTSVDIGHCPVHVRGDETEDPKGPVHQHRAFSIPGSGRALSTVAGTIRNETTWTAEISEVFQGTSNGRVSANPLISNSILLVRDEGVVGSNPITPTIIPENLGHPHCVMVAFGLQIDGAPRSRKHESKPPSPSEKL